MKTLSYTLCAVLAAGFAFTGDAQVKPKSKKVTELKYSGRIQAQWDGIGSDDNQEDDRNHFYFRRLFLGGHAKMGDNWGGDIVMDFAASTNTDDTVFIDGASVWYKHSDAFRLDVGQLKVPFGVEETTSSSKLKAIERSAVNRQFAEALKFNARHTGLFAKGALTDGWNYNLAVVNSGQNHASKDGELKHPKKYDYDDNELGYYGRLSYDNYDGELRYGFGAAAGNQALDETPSTAGATAAKETTAYNIFGHLGFGSLNFEAEYMSGTVSTVSDGDHDHKGYSFQASYALSNAPNGSWEFLYRYSTVESSKAQYVHAGEIIRRSNLADTSMDELDQHYLGVNYLFNGHDAKLMVGYELNDLFEGGVKEDEANGFRARVQFLF